MWILDTDAPVPAWRCRDPRPAFLLAFSTRRGGVSAPPFDTLNVGRSTVDDPAHVVHNRGRFLASLGLGLEAIATAGQVHGARVEEVDAPGHVLECDALLTRRP